jgi:hypothetical protein
MTRSSQGQVLSEAEEGTHMRYGTFKEDNPARALLSTTTTTAAAVVGGEVLSILGVPWRRHLEPKSEVLTYVRALKSLEGGREQARRRRGEEREKLFYARYGEQKT